MNLKQMPKLRLGDLETSVPIVQGGMGVGISLSGLASAVANEGGIGVISTAGIGMLEPDFNRNFREANNRALRREIKKARQKTQGVIGVNIMVALTDFTDLLLASAEEGADIVFLGAGLPLKIPEFLLSGKNGRRAVKIVPIVSSARAAQLIFQYWARNYHHVPDGVVVEGPLAGGHLGFSREHINDPEYALEKILPGVIAAVQPYEESFGKSIPVIAAGGIFSGADIYRHLEAGAGGVQMATRFVATHECDAAPAFKETYVNCRQEDLVIIDSPVGLPGRAIKNKFLEMVSKGFKKPIKCPWKCLKTCDFTKSPYCIGAALTNAKNGILDKGFAFAGANTYRINAITTVKKLIDSLLSEYNLATGKSPVAVSPLR
ncbi:MAG: nitronate monooxygenase [Dehalococcoidales bacterium]|nr:nitronate monooxygenase [Dehalococcoidales bacterium]